MYAMTGRLFARKGMRDNLIQTLLRASALVSEFPGCRAYIVLADAADEHAVAVFEMWDDKQAHDASLLDDGVRALISEAMPLLEGTPAGNEYAISGGFGAPE